MFVELNNKFSQDYFSIKLITRSNKMFGGRFSSGDPMIDKILYGATAVIIISALIIFGSPLYNSILASLH